MSSSSSRMYQYANRDLYKVLRVEPSATLQEIRKAYRSLALKLHPDVAASSDSSKSNAANNLRVFQEINEAYSILGDAKQRAEYDLVAGHRHRRRTNIPKDYRKVYTSRPPPNWKFTWDHSEHYRMHYGQGFQEEAIKEAVKSAKKEGAFDYHSTLGKGFTFAADDDQDAARAAHDMGHDVNTNPFAKHSPQGPPKVVFEYEEGSKGMDGSGKQHVHRKERIVEDMMQRRTLRKQQQASQFQQQQQRQQRYNGTIPTMAAAAQRRNVMRSPQEEACAIM